ncbi:MAG: extracellular solute-binding protein [Snowella sp.]|nr:extracellular solute-binding protein [Snowella sp.]
MFFWQKLGLGRWAFISSIFILTACQASRPPNSISQKQDPLQGTIIFWFGIHEEYTLPEQITQYEKFLKSGVAKFHHIYPKTNVLIKLVPEQELIPKFLRDTERGLGPDLIHTETSTLFQLLKTHRISPITSRKFILENFRPDALTQVSLDHYTYALPSYLGTQVLCYNKQKVHQVPTTLTELLQQARMGYSVGLLSNFEDTLWGTQIFGGKLFNNKGQGILDQGGWAKWMNWLKMAKDEPNFILNDDPLALQKAFIDGQLAYMVCWSPSISVLRQLLGPDKFGVAVLPGEGKHFAGPPLMLGVLLFSAISSPQQSELALKFAQFLTNPEQQRTWVSQWQAAIPSNKLVMIDKRLFPVQGVIQSQSQTAITFTLEEVERLKWIGKEGQGLYQKVLLGDISPEAAATELTQIINAEPKRK